MARTRITGTSDGGTKVERPFTADASTPCPAGDGGSDNTEKTANDEPPSRQDWLEILLSLAEKLEFPIHRVAVAINGTDKPPVIAILLPGVRQHGGELVID